MALQKEALKNYILAGSKDREDLQVGVEWEKIGIFKKTGQAIPYSGPRGVEAIFKALIHRFGWSPVSSSGPIIALSKENSSITLEPGGQIELSGRKAHALKDNQTELEAHLNEIKRVSRPLGVAWLGLGLQPFSRVEAIEWVPKERYRIMRRSLKNKGTLTTRMMKQTASVQISIDFLDERDAVKKLRLAMGLAPILSALFANSPILEGKRTRTLSTRAHIWLHTAPERTGIIPAVFDPGFSLDDYVSYALEVPLLFIVRNGRWLPVARLSFRQFMQKGMGPHTATIDDWALHLTTIFTEARLKNYLEIRSMDCQTPAMGLAAPALLKGIFYSAKGMEKAWELVAEATHAERLRLSRIAPTQGLSAVFKGRTLLAISKELVSISEAGLPPGEIKYLKPLKWHLKKGKCPAEILLEKIRGLSGNKLVREIIRHTVL